MTHTLYRARLALHSPFGTPLAGDTLFGQLCWALRESAGEAALKERLAAGPVSSGALRWEDASKDWA